MLNGLMELEAEVSIFDYTSDDESCATVHLVCEAEENGAPDPVSIAENIIDGAFEVIEFHGPQNSDPDSFLRYVTQPGNFFFEVEDYGKA